MTDPNPNGQRDQDDDQSRVELVSGLRSMTLAALREQIAAQFTAETPETALQTESDETLRERLREVTDYLLELNVSRLPRRDKLALINQVFSDLFRYGPLDSPLSDPTVTEISADGPSRVFVQHGLQPPQPAESVFESTEHFTAIITRLLAPTGFTYSQSAPIIEVGRTLLDRRLRLTIAAPPATPALNVTIRLHPPQRPTLDDLIAQGFLSAPQAEQIKAHLAAHGGLMLIGDVGAGKTTLLQALLPLLPAQSAVVQRAEELDPPLDHVQLSGPDFAVEIGRAAALGPPWLVLDEARFEEGGAFWATLNQQSPPACLWVFRGAARADRFTAAFSMAIRRAEPGVDQGAILDVMIRAFPVALIVGRRAGRLGVLSINHWERDGDRAILRTIVTE